MNNNNAHKKPGKQQQYLRNNIEPTNYYKEQQ